MNELQVFSFNQVDVVDSRDVAQMVEKRHTDLLRDIRGYIDIMEKPAERKIASGDFFLKSSYTDGNNQERPCYLLTKKGCDMVANKMTGEKGVLFTAAYVTAFEKMREQTQTILPQDYPSALRALADTAEKNLALIAENAQQQQIIAEYSPKASYYDLVLQTPDAIAVSKIAKDYGKSAKWLNQKLHEKGVQFKQGDIWLLYQKHAEMGYTQSKTHTYADEQGGQHSRLHTYWTQKGRLFIYSLLKEDGILPLIEQNKESENREDDAQ